MATGEVQVIKRSCTNAWSCTDMIDQEPKLIYKYP